MKFTCYSRGCLAREVPSQGHLHIKKPKWAERTLGLATSPHSKGAHDGPWRGTALYDQGINRLRNGGLSLRSRQDGIASLPLDCEKSSL